METQQIKELADEKFTEQINNLERYYNNGNKSNQKSDLERVFDQFRDEATRIF